jgi:hypothetical protein
LDFGHQNWVSVMEPANGTPCIMCEKFFSQVHAYWCKKCSHTLSNAASELRACEDDVRAATVALEAHPAFLAAKNSGSAPFVRRMSSQDAKKRLAALQAAMAASATRASEHKARAARLRERAEQEKGEVERERAQIEALQRAVVVRQAAGSSSSDLLRDKKVELVAQLFGLLPVFPTIQSTIRIVNFAVRTDEAYHDMDPDEAAAVASYFVKITSLMGKYLEVCSVPFFFFFFFFFLCKVCQISLPNEIGTDNHRWTIRPRGVNLAPISLHPRVAGPESFKMAMKLLEQNAVRLCFDQGIAIRRGHEHEIAQNLFRLVSFLSNDKGVGLGSSGPFPERVVVPAKSHREDDEFVLV